MMGTTVQLGRRHGADRFYDATKARRGHQHNLARSRGSAAAAAAAAPPKEKVKVAAAPLGTGNLERFVAAVAPSVPAQYLSESMVRGRRSCGGGGVDEGRLRRPYFALADLWESFKEWSAYGAGVPLVLDGCDGVVQYYVPYLSAIQLYGDPSILHSSRQMMEDSDGDCQDSSSDGSSDYEHEKKFYTEWGYNNLVGTSLHQTDKLPSRVKVVSSQEGFSSDDNESGDSHGRLLFEYLEFDSPFCREPLADKISNLSARFPGLKTLRSCDLLPRSWISVAWYPIYRIPTGPTLKDLDACFLTFHSLSTLLEGDLGGGAVPIAAYPRDVHGTPKISLPVFGMASYKFRNSIWSSSEGDWQLASGLLQAADDWLRNSRARHPDYQFFVSRGAFQR